MKIKDIISTTTNKTRTDGRYPQRVGCTAEFYMKPSVGMPMILAYVYDNHGNPKEGYLRTSTVEAIHETDSKIIVTTLNSIYCLEKE
jgi:hypothetical protein